MTPEAVRPLTFAIRHINASARNPIDAGELLDALTADPVPPAHEHHVRAFFDEADLGLLSELVRSGAVTYATLALGARRFLPDHHQTRRWLDERA